jgi:hypothetical protein
MGTCSPIGHKQEHEVRWELGYILHQDADSGAEAQPLVRGAGAISIDEVRSDNRAMHDYRAATQLGQSVWLNVQDFLASVAASAKEFCDRRTFSEDDLDMLSLAFSRQLANILSMFRSFVDHSDTSILRRFGEDSEQFAAWKAALSGEYDASFSYRLICRLRNYSQHVGVVPMHFSYSATLSPAISLRIDLSRDALLNERSVWNSQLRQELHATPERMSLLDHLDEWSRSFLAVARARERLERDAALSAARRILSRRAQFGVPSEATRLCALLVQVNADDGSVACRMEGINERWAQRIVDGPWFASPAA